MIAVFVVTSTLTLTYPYAWAPGVRNPNITEQILCSSTFRTKSIRPPTTYTSLLKRQQLKDHPEIQCGGVCEEDHVWPIEAGGDPRDPRNLSPEPETPRPGWHEKDKVENWWHREICAGRMTIDDVKNQLPYWRDIYERERLGP